MASSLGVNHAIMEVFYFVDFHNFLCIARVVLLGDVFIMVMESCIDSVFQGVSLNLRMINTWFYTLTKISNSCLSDEGLSDWNVKNTLEHKS